MAQRSAPVTRFNPLLGADQVDKLRDVAARAEQSRADRQRRSDEEEIIMSTLEGRS